MTEQPTPPPVDVGALGVKSADLPPEVVEEEARAAMLAEAQGLSDLERLAPSQRVALVEQRAHLLRCQLGTLIATLELPGNQIHTIADLDRTGWTPAWRAEFERTIEATRLGPKPDELERPLPSVRNLDAGEAGLCSWATRAAVILNGIREAGIGERAPQFVDQLEQLLAEARSAGLLEP